ncbi:aminopeptidase M1 [Eucalyptus grandis]|uniref:aminopeptidase M1 n=1 Tax=Eucalyptus grandis TaxID=71139 RepID=UPI00192F105F|nr:aminopeptidase M1 [Eucalyptus grandis]
MEQFKGQPRLPKFASPKRYDIRLKPDLATCKFSGSVAIDLDIVSKTKFIVLNAADLSIQNETVSFTHKAFSSYLRPAPGRTSPVLGSAPSSSSTILSLFPSAVLNYLWQWWQRLWTWFFSFPTLERFRTKVFEPCKVDLVGEDEILVLEFPETLPTGIGVLAIDFDGILNDEMKGFYRSTYEHNGEKKNMAVTQFEPVDARRCFPCWDEPACKATFKISLDVPADLVALSNMPTVDEKVEGHVKTVFYQESPIMSTYLVAVVVGLFDYVEDHTSDGVKVRVYCQVGKQNQGKFALNVAVKTLEFYREYFAVPYSLPKLDMIAIPDFAYDAMENYGLVTYHETALLYDEQHSAAANKQRVSIVVTHELAHQWFGNLVTMEWWTHLWLNEGVATWVSYLATDRLFPEWESWTQFLQESVEGLRLDELAESHPIEVEINPAGEIGEIFNAISYRKGASVIRMLQSYLGAECFQRSLAAYIKRHACSNAKTEDLCTALEEGSGEPVNKLMNSWTKQKGYPVVSVKINDNKLEFEQSQFLLSGSHGDGQWIVPIIFCCGSYDACQSFLLETKSASIDLEENEAWIKVNVDQTGFYRVKYDEDLQAELRYAIETKMLSATDRFGILDDSFALCMARQQSLTSLLTLMAAYGEELDYTVLSNLISISYKIARIAADATPELVDSIRHFFIILFQHSAEKLGWEAKEGESHLDAMLRGQILTALAKFGDEPTLREASRRFHAFLNDRSTPLLSPDIRKAAYVAVMQTVNASNRSGFESLLRVYEETDLSQEKTRILESLASCPDPNIFLEVLGFILFSEDRSQDAVFGLAVCWEGRETAWNWLKENWEYIAKTWGSGVLIRRFVSSIVSPFASFEKAREVEDFFATRSQSSIARTLKQSIERVNINAHWVQSIQNEENIAETVDELLYG